MSHPITNGNAEAAPSRPRSGDRARSASRARRQNANPNVIPTTGQATKGGIAANQGSKRASCSTPFRKVRTVPPSAQFDPPSPQLAPSIILPTEVTATGSLITNPAPTSIPIKRRRNRLQYLSSSSSFESASDDSESDEEPPWWTFTQRGMQRLRAVAERGRTNMTTGSEVENGGEAESGWESAALRHKHKDRERTREISRHKGKEKEKGKDKDKEKPNERRKLRGREDSGNSSAPNSAVIIPSRSSKPSFMFRPTNLKALRRFSGLELETSELSSDNLNHSIPVAGPSSAPAMARSSSAPSSPTQDGDLLHHLSLGISSDRLHLEPAPPLTVPSPKTSSFSRQSYRRQNSAPGPRRNLNDKSLTDSETMTAPSRLRSRRRIIASFAHPLHERAEDSEGVVGASGGIASDHAEITKRSADGEDRDNDFTPTRLRARRMQSHNLKIRLPPPISVHFAHGWPHAGSWQDALYGNYDEVIAMRSAARKAGTPSSRMASFLASGIASAPQSRKASVGRDFEAASKTLPTFRTNVRSGSDPNDSTVPNTPRHGPRDGSMRTPIMPGISTTPTNAPAPKKRARSRRPRNRRYRTAQIPPTPGGLGFTPRERAERGSISESGFDQGAEGDTEGNAGLGLGVKGSVAETEGMGERTNPFDRIAEEELVREETIVSENCGRMKEKNGQGGDGTVGKGWLNRGRRGRKSAVRKKYIEELDWRTRFRRTLFLDARVTVYLRVINLAVMVSLLALAVRIRLELISLGTPGVIGPSTTMIISYSSFTILHTLTAIYREYFGRPIGLWGLRSKMLWVCLDLLFVSIWSSAISLATNDYIFTPLDCTPLNPWWTSDVDDYDLANMFNAETSRGGVRSSARLTDTSVSVLTILTDSDTAHAACERQVGCIALSLLALLLYAGNMVLSLFRIFETVRRTADPAKAMMV